MRFLPNFINLSLRKSILSNPTSRTSPTFRILLPPSISSKSLPFNKFKYIFFHNLFTPIFLKLISTLILLPLLLLLMLFKKILIFLITFIHILLQNPCSFLLLKLLPQLLKVLKSNFLPILLL